MDNLRNNTITTTMELFFKGRDINAISGGASVTAGNAVSVKTIKKVIKKCLSDYTEHKRNRLRCQYWAKQAKYEVAINGCTVLQKAGHDVSADNGQSISNLVDSMEPLRRAIGYWDEGTIYELDYMIGEELV